MTNEPSPRPWHLEGKCIYTAHGDFIGEMEHTDDARLVVDAVNGLRSEDAPAGFDPYCARHGCPNCRIYARLQEAKKKEESK